MSSQGSTAEVDQLKMDLRTASIAAQATRRSTPSGAERYRAVPLIERERELGRVGSLLAAVGGGEGAAVLIEGVAGIGKTSLVEALCERAARRGMRILRARAGEFERGLPFGVVRQMFEPLVAGASGPERDELLAGAARLAAGPLGLAGEGPEAASAGGGGELHGLYWLCANACDRGSLVLAVDDLHWADEASLRLLAYLARRASALPLLIVGAARPVAAESLAARALGGVWSEVLRPAALSGEGIERLVRVGLGTGVEEQFCAACARVTGGNPFLVVEMIAALRADGVEPVAAQASRLADLGSQTLAHSLLARLGRVGPDAVAVARAVSVLGRDALLRRVARLAGLRPEAVVAALEGLRREGIAATGARLELAHPLMRDAVLTDLAEPARGLAHLRVAGLLREEGEAAERIAVHLAAAEPTGESWVVEVLREAAAAAIGRGAPESAVALLDRALAEPPAARERWRVLGELGAALASAGRERKSFAALIEAASLAPDAVAQAQVTVGLGPLLGAFAPDALAALCEARQLLGDLDGGLAERLEAAIAFARHVNCEPVSAWAGPLEAELRTTVRPAGGIPRLSVLAYAAASTGARPAEEVIRMASDAASRAGAADDPGVLNAIVSALRIAGRPSVALGLLDGLIDAASRTGNAARFGLFSILRALNHLVAGSAEAAEADARAAFAALDEPAGRLPYAVGVLLRALVQRGLFEEAESELAARDMETRDAHAFQDFALLHGRGSLRLAQGRAGDARDDFLMLGKWLTGVGITNPSYAEWRSLAAVAHLALGETDRARALAVEELELARGFGATRAIGISLRTLGLAEGGTEGLELLRESIRVLDGSEAELELARSNVEHGAALRRAGQRRDAREPLRRGLDLARRSGSTPLAQRAHQELLAAGARPRREQVSGPDSLTASELRVARLAATGRTNGEIAQSLFVARRTVEIHLTRAYRKLDIATRRELSAVLDAD